MKKYLIATAVIAALATPALAANDLELIKGRFYQNGSYADQVFTLKNHKNRTLQFVRAKCGVFDDDELIDTSGLSFQNVPPNGEAYDHANTVGRGHVTRIDCRIEDVE